MPIKPSHSWTQKQWDANFELTARGKFRHLLTGPQRDFYDFYKNNPDIRQYGLYCTRKLGKTFTALLIAFELANEKVGLYRFILPSLKLAKEVVYPLYGELLEYIPKANWPRLMKSEASLIFKNGSKIILGGASPENADNNRGPLSHGIFLDECAFYDQKSYDYLFKSVLFPQLTMTNGPIFYTTTPPEDVTHPFITETLATLKAFNSVRTYTIEDNNLLTEADRESIAALYGSGDAEIGRQSKGFRREYMCELIPDESRLVVPEFSKTRHVVSTPLYSNCVDHFGTAVREYIGYCVADYGVGSQDFAGILSGYLDHIRGKLVITGEALLKGKSLGPFIAEFNKLKEEKLPLSKEETIEIVDFFEQVRRTSVDEYHFTPRRPSKARVEDIIGLVRNVFELNKIEIHESCKHLIDQLTLGLWKENEKTKDFERSDVLGHLDLLMALAYMIRAVDWKKRPGISTNLNLRLG